MTKQGYCPICDSLLERGTDCSALSRKFHCSIEHRYWDDELTRYHRWIINGVSYAIQDHHTDLFDGMQRIFAGQDSILLPPGTLTVDDPKHPEALIEKIRVLFGFR